MRKFVSGVALCAAAITACAAYVDVGQLNEDGMFPFVPSYDAPQNVVNMSHLLEAPAGKHGRIRVKGDCFVNDKGRVRLNATNLTGPANFPTHEQADRLAARLARFGFNCVRLHFLDAESYGHEAFKMQKEQCIFAKDPSTKRKFDPKQRDLLDYLVAQFKKRGIYVNVNLHVARHLDARDGFPAGTPWGNKGVNQFDPRIIAEQKAYAKELLEHVNPYTGMSYLKDPVVAMVELNNEDALWDEFLGGGLNNLGQSYATTFRNLWNEWLCRKYGTMAKLAEAWDVKTASRAGTNEYKDFETFDICKGTLPAMKNNSSVPMPVIRDFYQFLTDTERAYWTGMQKYLQRDLGLEAPVSATQLAHSLSVYEYAPLFGYSPPHVQADLDFVDNHSYWCHPRVGGKWTIRNLAMVDKPGGYVAALASVRVAGKPYTISEYNHPYPNLYGAEGQPMLHAYGALQGWDGLFEYTYNCCKDAEPINTQYYFSIAARSDVMVHMPACAAMYLRGDVKESSTRLVGNLPYDQYFDRLCKSRLLSQSTEHSESKLPTALGLVHGVAVDVTGKTKGPEPGTYQKPKGLIVSDTKELKWSVEKGGSHWIVDTENTKFFTGFPMERTFDLGGVKLEIGKTKLGWATVSFVSQNAAGFGGDGRATRILLAATGLSHNGGAKFTKHNGDMISCRGEDWGFGKTVCEGIPATITLPSSASRTKCFALDERGERKAELSVTATPDGHAVVKIDPRHKTLWYEIACNDQ